LLIAFTLAGCAQYATVSVRRPRYQPAASTAPWCGTVRREIASAVRAEKRQPLPALGCLLTAAETSARQLAVNPADTAARDAYNYSVARIIGHIQHANLDPWSQTLRVPAAGGDFALSRAPDSRKSWNPALYEFTPADQFDVKGTYVRTQTLRPGIGAALVAVGKERNERAAADFAVERIYYGVTALVRFQGRRAVIEFNDPLAVERVTMAGRSFPLAADFTVPIAVMLAKTNPKKLELARLLNPEKYAETARITRLQPYDPNKRVVLVIHGLGDSPATWTPMLNDLRGDESIRRNYQFWFYSYPSGYPYPHSAAILRHDLDAIEKRYPLQKKMVVIGHSMGGCISRLLLTDTTDQKLWLALAHKPPGEIRLSPEVKNYFTDALIFRPRKEIGRVIFIAAPLRGSDLASNWVGRVGSFLVRTPKAMLRVQDDVLKLVTFQDDDLRLSRMPNSVDTLAPNNRFVKAIQKVPISSSVPYHVISGDRGKGGNLDRTPPVRSDGVVPYWSSHMEGAESELVVPSNHSAHQNAQAIAEVKRILTQHASR
jgi:pimeloyl-ACP methyl ester carboxylesterase